MAVLLTIDDEKLVCMIQGGAVGIIPTDTVYGLVALANITSSVDKLYRLKRREGKPGSELSRASRPSGREAKSAKGGLLESLLPGKPGTIIAADIDQLVRLGIKKRYLTAVERFWPGAISIIIPTGPALEYLHKGKQSLAIRIPADKKLLSLLKKTGPLVTTSANQPGEPPVSTVKQAVEVFGDSLDFYVDGGDLSRREPSTIIRIVDDAIEIIRPGAVKINETGEIK